jgi:benzoyl-CoA reductase/2-hydroxyglutaryl-CoA dehydratase subunit BcrC/BadD/HgdB
MVVGETTCDGKKKAFEILNDYVPVHMMETPQMKREKDKVLWRSEVRDFLTAIEQFTGKRLPTTPYRGQFRMLTAREKCWPDWPNCTKTFLLRSAVKTVS